jgi:hypothetical protein
MHVKAPPPPYHRRSDNSNESSVLKSMLFELHDARLAQSPTFQIEHTELFNLTRIDELAEHHLVHDISDEDDPLDLPALLLPGVTPSPLPPTTPLPPFEGWYLSVVFVSWSNHVLLYSLFVQLPIRQCISSVIRVALYIIFVFFVIEFAISQVIDLFYQAVLLTGHPLRCTPTFFCDFPSCACGMTILANGLGVIFSISPMICTCMWFAIVFCFLFDEVLDLICLQCCSVSGR